jgi:phosphatidylinositol alpha-1,6-mannosyltransferase
MTRPAQILLIANNFPPVRGGSAVVYANLARCAPDRIIVIAPRISYVDGLPIIGWREHDRLAPYRVIRLPLLRTTLGEAPRRGADRLWFIVWDAALRLRLLWTMLRLVCAGRVRAVCVGELLASAWIIRLLRLIPGVRSIVYVHGEEITTEDPYDTTRQRCRQTLLQSDRVIVVSRFTLGAVRSLLHPARDDRISMIENGVDTTRFHLGPKSPELLGLYQLQGCFVFVSVCRLLEKKGIDQAVRAFDIVVRRYPDCRFLIVGTGPYQAALGALVEQHGLGGQVTFAGQVSDTELVDHYRLGDVFVMPNRELPNGDTEGFGLVFLEANSCGLPVVAGRDGGSTDAVQDGVNGYVVDGHSVGEIAAAMLRLRSDPAQREAMRDRALAAAARADWQEKVQEFLAIAGMESRHPAA